MVFFKLRCGLILVFYFILFHLDTTFSETHFSPGSREAACTSKAGHCKHTFLSLFFFSLNGFPPTSDKARKLPFYGQSYCDPQPAVGHSRLGQLLVITASSWPDCLTPFWLSAWLLCVVWAGPPEQTIMCVIIFCPTHTIILYSYATCHHFLVWIETLAQAQTQTQNTSTNAFH